MNNKTKTLIEIAVFAVFILVAVFAYNRLSENFKPETPFAVEGDEATNVEESEIEDNEATSIEESEIEDSEATNVEENKTIPAPDFTAYDNEGNEVKLSDYFGKPIVLNFWASWCSPCKSEMPHFNKVYDEMKDDVVFLMVDLVDDQQETEDKGKAYIAENEFIFPVLFDTNQDAAYAYGIRSIPSTLFIDKDGNIVAGVEGSIDEETIRKGIGLITKEDVEMKKAEYHKISPEEARKILDENSNAILLDVRREEEFNEKHIEGAILIPDYELEDRASDELPDKNALILVYCRSGNRSKTAADLLVSMGYTNVYDFGGINSYPYETVSN